MPQAQYIHNGNTHNFNIIVPKRITSLWHWYKECFKSCTAVPIIPKDALSNQDGWMIEHQEADLKWIKFDLMNNDGRKAYIVILR